MFIEQNIMHSMKVKGGLISGHGFSDSVLTQWILSGPGCLKLCDVLEKLCGISNTSSEQHVELRDSRRSRDDLDIKKFLDWFSAHPPFQTPQVLQSMFTGVAGENINCDQATAIGKKAVNHIIGGNFMIENISADCKVVVDGGYLWHALVWSRPAAFDQICEAYVTFVQKQFSLTATVVSDDDKCTTKGKERRRWFAGRFSTDISIAANNVVTSMQVDFLRNDHSKNGLIKLLVTYFQASGYHVVQCSGDADTTIAAIALQYETSCGVKVIATDTDNLAMLTARADEDTHSEVFHPSSGKTTGKIFSISAIQWDIGEMKNHILFCHAMSGSDITSAFFGKGKKQAWNIIKSDVSIRSTVEVFMHPNADKMDIISAGEKFAMSLYQGYDNYATLDELRIHIYTHKIAKLPVSASLQLASLPPTDAACEQHSLWVYLRIQEWLSHSLDPVVWGWESVSGTLVPITISLPPAPE
ncbi:hypothetical protein PR048_030052 [Dryococelus australis]|uniref:NYN domain-containing protein n=1 Tax=Dryococelus australis TaxID=614101 RepID=A0ABQ9G7U9_9NEOP|nr:hypothetical protein PR048_030052 [Dryococelus australis]